MYGAILGDIIGSPYEFDRGSKTKDFPLFSGRSEFTDDTVMSIAVADAFLPVRPEMEDEVIRQRVIAKTQKYGRLYPHAGYGGRFRRWLRDRHPKPYNSWGNGSAMRVSSVGWLYNNLEQVRRMARLSAEDSFQPKIHLLGAYYGPEMETDFEGGVATVLADKTEGYMCLLVKGDEVKVTAYDDDTATIWLGEEQYAEIPRWLLKLESDADYESWTGYSRWNGIIYEEYQMDTEKTKLSTNKQVTVLDEVNGCYVVEYEGQIGYMEPDKVSEKKITSNPGNGGGSGSPGSTWTPPKL